ncbi:hypothetical protein H2199_001353 [Coniosporium tulheliwenetii]|uniref:Uncharacterized protein n=1 Tax=Coniosporium tulheliwenetii TaxID=3383036 RepID=A0ACC2ZLN7_9PEZI|nr:hypothetical protein H2199_001353 [Cladosporium sp. JES 115]
MPPSAKKPRLSSASQRDAPAAAPSPQSSSLFSPGMNGTTHPPATADTPPQKTIDWNAVGPDFDLRALQNQKRKRARNATTPQPSKAHFTDSLSVVYSISPATHWESTSKFRKFTIANESFQLGDIVLIHNESPLGQPWLAKVLEVRAGDEQHVYLRVFWLYRPEELPNGGRRPYHGRNELVASNDMQIIDAMTVDGRVEVRHWDEADEAEELFPADQLFWRQTWDAVRGVLSKPREHCVCHRPFNPDRLLIACGHCKTWMHAECIVADAIERAHEKEGLPPPIIDKDAFADAGVDVAAPPAISSSILNGAESSPAQPSPQKRRGRPRKSSGASKEAGPIPPAFTAELVTKTPDPAQEDGGKRGILGGLLNNKAGTEKKTKIVVTDIRKGGGGASYEEAVRCLACGQEVV